ncbi:MAG: hypothetical protein H6907_19115 [Hyphomicrobiales bacterium]|nr:hypothetical protein [Hyphomicrobiales bacterium]MCP5373847.1 hypothetical protein [Hyphomicrobiales bacterium]
MPSRIGPTLAKIVVLSFVVGLALHFFDIDPARLLDNFGETALMVFEKGVQFIQWAAKYILLGAVVVVPLWAIVWIVGYARGKGGKG